MFHRSSIRCLLSLLQRRGSRPVRALATFQPDPVGHPSRDESYHGLNRGVQSFLEQSRCGPPRWRCFVNACQPGPVSTLSTAVRSGGLGRSAIALAREAQWLRTHEGCVTQSDSWGILSGGHGVRGLRYSLVPFSLVSHEIRRAIRSMGIRLTYLFDKSRRIHGRIRTSRERSISQLTTDLVVLPPTLVVDATVGHRVRRHARIRLGPPLHRET